MKSSEVLLKLIRGISGGGSGSGSGSGSDITIPETEPEGTVWANFESNSKTILNSVLYKTKDMEILAQTTQNDSNENTDFIHTGVYDGNTQLYKLSLKSGSTTKNIYMPQDLVYVSKDFYSNSAITAPRERLYYNSEKSKYCIDKYYERLIISPTNLKYTASEQHLNSANTIFFSVTNFNQTYITNNNYLVDNNNQTCVCGNYGWTKPGNMNTIYNITDTEGVFLAYNGLMLRVNKARLTDEGFTTDLGGVQSWLSSLSSKGKPLTLYLPKKEVEIVETNGISDINIITYEGKNELKITNGNGIIKCQYPTAG